MVNPFDLFRHPEPFFPKFTNVSKGSPFNFFCLVSSLFVRPQTSLCMCQFLCTVHFYYKYSVLDFERNQSLEKPFQSRRTPPPFSKFFGTRRLSPPVFSFVRLFWKMFLSPKGLPFIFLILCN